MFGLFNLSDFLLPSILWHNRSELLLYTGQQRSASVHNCQWKGTTTTTTKTTKTTKMIRGVTGMTAVLFYLSLISIIGIIIVSIIIIGIAVYVQSRKLI